MKAEDIYKTLAVKPFHPMRVHLKDGKKYDIPCRALAIVGVSYLDVGIQARGHPEGIWETGITIPIEQILEVRPVEQQIPKT